MKSDTLFKLLFSLLFVALSIYSVDSVRGKAEESESAIKEVEAAADQPDDRELQYGTNFGFAAKKTPGGFGVAGFKSGPGFNKNFKVVGGRRGGYGRGRGRRGGRGRGRASVNRFSFDDYYYDDYFYGPGPGRGPGRGPGGPGNWYDDYFYGPGPGRGRGRGRGRGFSSVSINRVYPGRGGSGGFVSGGFGGFGGFDDYFYDDYYFYSF